MASIRLGIVWIVAGLVCLLGVLTSVLVASAEQTAERCPGTAGWSRLPLPDVTVMTKGWETFLTIASSWLAPDELYAGGAWGLYHSDTCGQRWERIVVPGTPNIPSRISQSVETVAAGREGTLYVGNGPDAIMVSSDGGATWKAAVSADPGLRGMPYARSQAIVASPARSLLAYAALRQESLRGVRGFARTEDGGRTWFSRNPNLSATIFAPDATNPDVVYFAYGGGNLVRSTDGGETFAQYAQLPGTITALAMSADGARLWAALEGGALHGSGDRGLSWEPVAEAAPAGTLTRLAVSPFDPGLVFAVAEDGSLWLFREVPAAP